MTAAAVGEVKDIPGDENRGYYACSVHVLQQPSFLGLRISDCQGGEGSKWCASHLAGTWGLFFISHASAMAYALVNNEDWIMAFMFLANAIGCGAVLLITAWKRSQHRSRTRQYETTPTVLDVLARKMGSSIRKAWLRRSFSRKKTGSWTDGPLSGF